MKTLGKLREAVTLFLLYCICGIAILAVIVGIIGSVVSGLIEPASRLLTCALAGIFIGSILLGINHTKKWTNQMLMERAGESICTFARSLPARSHDTKIVRVVYESLHKTLSVPLRPHDELEETLKMDPWDIEDFVVEMAESSGKSMDGWEANPLAGQVITVADLIRFLEMQPSVKSAA